MLSHEVGNGLERHGQGLAGGPRAQRGLACSARPHERDLPLQPALGSQDSRRQGPAQARGRDGDGARDPGQSTRRRTADGGRSVMRPRGKRPIPGTGIGVREAAREYKVDASVIRYQVGKGIIKKVSDGMLDAASVWDWYTDYTPHTDNRSRRHRTIPELAPAPPPPPPPHAPPAGPRRGPAAPAGVPSGPGARLGVPPGGDRRAGPEHA